VDNHDNGRA